MKILALPGSLRANSSSNVILKAMVAMIPSSVEVEIYGGIGTLPHFNDAATAPDTVEDFRSKISTSDVVLICTPEYAFGVPGSLKNALDWTVASGEFIDKPVGLVTASSNGEKGHAALLLILEALSAKIIEGATLLISFVRAKVDKGNVKDPGVTASLHEVILSLTQSKSKE
jgi:NAD(P)H-dependent FMN reductase